MINRSFPNHAKQQGVVVIVVILIITLMVTLLAFMIERQHLLIRRVANQNIAEQGFQYAEAINAWAERILNDDLNRQSDYLFEDWAKFGQSREQLNTEEGEVFLESDPSEEAADNKRIIVDIGFDGLEYSIDDLQARFNLNNLSSSNAQFVETQKRIFINILELLEIGDFEQRERLFGALVDWVDEDSLFHKDSSGDTESISYQIKPTPYFSSDQRLTSIGELKFVEGFTNEIITKLTPYVTVLPVDNARININTADAEVVSSLSSVPVVNTSSVIAFLARRLEIGFQGFSQADIRAAETAIMGLNPLGNRPVANMMQVNSQFFQINAKVSLGGNQYCMKTIVLREPITGENVTPKISVLRREQDTLCRESVNHDEVNEQ